VFGAGKTALQRPVVDVHGVKEGVSPPGEMKPGSVKHTPCHCERRTVHPLSNPILLRSVGRARLMARAFGFQEGFEGLVEELFASISFLSPEDTARLILHPSQPSVKCSEHSFRGFVG
jgi:hypothetical protein